VNGPTIEVVVGDIVTVPVDAVVTAANRSLRGGTGVNGAVHAAAGPELLRASRALAPCPAGSAVVTPAFAMTTATWVVHAVGPQYHDPQDEPVLAAAYTAALARADEVGAQSVAFPSISTGRYGYPDADAARISVTALRRGGTSVRRVVLVARHEHTAELWRAELDRTSP
jgi:O-acetyl-ADP-ribose deacetylase (regulator of RNase III)